MYGLPQAGILAEKQLIRFLGSYGYSPVPHTPGLWHHQWRPITFCLVVDDFGIKYISKEHADHLIQCLQNHYQEDEINWAGKQFCGIHLNWDYANCTCDLSMPGYVEHALHKFQHPTPKNHRIAPIPQQPTSTASKSSSLTPLILQPDYPLTKSKGSNKSSALSYFRVVLSIQHF